MSSKKHKIKKGKEKRQEELGDMEVTLLKTAKLNSMDDNEVLDDDIAEVSNEENDLASALTLLGDDKEIIIDRDQEDKDVTEFQKTGDLSILERVYKNRIPTLKSWASKNYYPGLTTSVEDLFEDLSLVFVKAAQKYNHKRGTFNTCLFTFLINRIKNIHNSKYAKKRISEHYDGPISSMILSLDFAYNDGDGSDITLKDIIASKPDAEESLDFRDTISFLSKDNAVLKDFFKKICSGNSLAAVLKEYKTKELSMDLSSHKSELKKLKARRNKKLVSEIIKENGKVSGSFRLLDYNLDDDQLHFKVEMRKTKETDVILKAIRELKKHKEYYVSKIRGH
jgi:hypothetical protein